MIFVVHLRQEPKVILDRHQHRLWTTCQADVRKSLVRERCVILRGEYISLQQNGKVRALSLDILQIEQWEPRVVTEEYSIRRQLSQEMLPIEVCRVVPCLVSNGKVAHIHTAQRRSYAPEQKDIYCDARDTDKPLLIGSGQKCETRVYAKADPYRKNHKGWQKAKGGSPCADKKSDIPEEDETKQKA